MNIGQLTIPDRAVVLAPMEDVTDAPFRLLCKEMGADIVYTEFISSEGIIRNAEKSLFKMEYSEKERPFGIQIFGGREEAMEGAAKVVEAHNPDLIDINFGCPVYNVVNKNAGAACLRDLGLMERMAGKVVDAVSKPVTVKTRLGWDDNSIRIVEVVKMLQGLGIKAVTIHARTRHQAYKGAARHEWLKIIKDAPGIHIPIIGNGDITSPEIAKKVFDETGVDGVMIGRAAIGDPWIFKRIKHYLEFGEVLPDPTWQEKIDICARHLRLSIEHHGEKRGLIMMKKHYGNYLKGIAGAKQLRMEVMACEDEKDILELLYNFEPERVRVAV
jgi:nifR3 family TIM-barrel protein